MAEMHAPHGHSGRAEYSPDRRAEGRMSPGQATEARADLPPDTHAEHGHHHGACGHSHAISRRLQEAHIAAREQTSGNRMRRALAIAAFGAARVVASSFCPLDDLVPLAMQVVHPAVTSIGQDQLAVLPRSSSDLAAGTLRLRAHGHHVPLDGHEPPSPLPEVLIAPSAAAGSPSSVAHIALFSC